MTDYTISFINAQGYLADVWHNCAPDAHAAALSAAHYVSNAWHVACVVERESGKQVTFTHRDLSL